MEKLIFLELVRSSILQIEPLYAGIHTEYVYHISLHLGGGHIVWGTGLSGSLSKSGLTATTRSMELLEWVKSNSGLSHK